MTERRIVEYRFARVSDLEYDGCLSTSVEHWLDVGYQPFGPPLAFEPDQSKWVQPMVRYAEPEPTPDDEQDAEIERLRAEVAQLKAERDYANEHFGYLTQSVDHLFTTFATTEHSDDPADAIKAVSRALYEFRKRAKRAGISMKPQPQTGGEG